MIFQGIDHKIQRLYIHWDITTKCNYNCSYCYAYLDYNKRNQWQKESDLKTIKLILKSIKISSLPVFLGLLGGEPTISKYYKYIIDYIYNEILDLKDDNRLYITTNLSKDLNWWQKHPKRDKVFILASFHPEHVDNLTYFLDKLDYLSKYFKVKLNIMLEKNSKEKLLSFYNLIKMYLGQKLLQNVIFHPHVIYPNGTPFIHVKKYYGKALEDFKYFFDLMKPEYEFFKNGSKIELNDYEVFTKNLNYFKDWKCWQNNYEIDNNGNVINLCNQKKDNLLQNPFFFKKISKIDPILCPNESCNCDGLLKCKKEKDD